MMSQRISLSVCQKYQADKTPSRWWLMDHKECTFCSLQNHLFDVEIGRAIHQRDSQIAWYTSNHSLWSRSLVYIEVLDKYTEGNGDKVEFQHGTSHEMVRVFPIDPQWISNQSRLVWMRCLGFFLRILRHSRTLYVLTKILEFKSKG